MLDFSYINTSPYFSGIALLMLNLGSRYIIGDLGEFHQKVLTTEIVKKFVIFCMFFIGTRDIVTSLILTAMFCILIYGIFNEKSKYSLVPNNDLIKQKLKEYYTNAEILSSNSSR
jgi:uncharacterized membrane protein (DUF485 family)